MKLLLMGVLLTMAAAGSLSAADWGTDYATALTSAKSQGKNVLLDFTGSDWCGYCQLLDKEVFSEPAFQNYADKNLVLVTVDFPRQTALPADLKTQNDGLASRFNINLYPTLILLDPSGNELGRVEGYNPGSGPDAVISRLSAIKSQQH